MLTLNAKMLIRCALTSVAFLWLSWLMSIVWSISHDQGTDKDLDAYSAFASPTSPSASFTSSRSPLTEYLHSRSIRSLVVCGIATDVCVKATVEVALSEGFSATIVQEACKGVDQDNSKAALQEFEKKGVRIARTVQAVS